MQAELAAGIVELIGTDVAEAFTYAGVSFNALIDDEEAPDLGNRGYDRGGRFDSVLTVDPSVAAFKSSSDGDQLPSKGELVTHTATGRKYDVQRVEFSAGSHVAYLHCRKGSQPAKAQQLHADGAPIANQDGSVVEPQ